MICRCFFRSLSYFINKGYFVISRLCPCCSRAARGNFSLATCIADSGHGRPPQAFLLLQVWLAGAHPPACLLCPLSILSSLLQVSRGESGQRSLRLAAWLGRASQRGWPLGWVLRDEQKYTKKQAKKVFPAGDTTCQRYCIWQICSSLRASLKLALLGGQNNSWGSEE